MLKYFALIALFSFCFYPEISAQDFSEEFPPSQVFNMDNEQDRSEFESLELDSNHPNLLNPEISGGDYDAVINSWTNLHERIIGHLEQSAFTWDSEAENISVVHKIYFESNGEIKFYCFKIRNEEISQDKKNVYAEIMQDFVQENQIDFRMEGSFAQCGKTRIPNP